MENSARGGYRRRATAPPSNGTVYEAQAAPVAGSLPAVLAAERAQNTATQNINRGLMDVAEQGQVGALGPVTPDPRVG